MKIDFVSAVCEEFFSAIEAVVDPNLFSPQDCWDPVVKIFGSDFNSSTLENASAQQKIDLRTAFVAHFECADITAAHISAATSAILRRWPSEE